MSGDLDLQTVLEGSDEELDAAAAEAGKDEGADTDEPNPVEGDGKGEDGDGAAAKKADADDLDKGAPPAPGDDDKAGSVAAAIRRDYQAKLDAKERELAELRARQKPDEEAPKRPDPVSHPKEYDADVDERIKQATMEERFAMSDMLAREKHGNEAVDAAVQAFGEAVKTDPSLKVKLGTERNPYGWVVQWHKDQQTRAEIGDPAQYREKIKGELLADPTFLAEVQKRLSDTSETKDEKPTPPPSLATETGERRPSVDTREPSLDEILNS